MKKAIKLELRKKITVKPSAPFAFDPTFYKPDHFTSSDHYWEPGTRWQTWNWKGAPTGVKFVNAGTADDPAVQISIYSNKELAPGFYDSLLREIKYLYNFDLDLRDFYKTFKNDKFLALPLKRMRGMRPGHPSCLYEYLIIGIVLQNASVRRSVQMFKALLENYGTLLEFDKKTLWCFWSPGKLEKVSEEELRTLKVGYRAKAIKRIDEHFFKGMISEPELREKDCETQERELLKLYGVGPATVWYLLFDVFHHWDFFNHISPWEQKIYSRLFFNRGPENPASVDELLKLFERYRNYKQLAVHYIWEDLFWRNQSEHIEWLEKEIRR